MRLDSWQWMWGAVVVVGGAVTATKASVPYAVTDLGPFDWPGVNVTGMNANGQVVGSLALPRTSIVRGFRSSPGRPISAATDELGTFSAPPGSGYASYAYSVNASGQAVGWAERGDSHYAFRTSANQAINPQTDDLGAGKGSSAYGINDSGQVVGGYGVGRAFRTGPNATFNAATDDLGNLGGGSAMARGINKSGQVVGGSTVSAGVQHAFRTASGAVIDPSTDDLGTAGGISSSASAINDNGQVVGNSQIANGETHAFRTAANAPINPTTDDLGTLGGPLSLARAINGAGEVVGYSELADQSIIHAFLYSGTAMQDLNDLIEPGLSGWMLFDAVGINDAGQIVGRGSHEGQGRVFLLTPVPEPSTLVLLAMGLLGLMVWSWQINWPPVPPHRRNQPDHL
jgi:probable HAF family extracellular repeat protein